MIFVSIEVTFLLIMKLKTDGLFDKLISGKTSVHVHGNTKFRIHGFDQYYDLVMMRCNQFETTFSTFFIASKIII